MTLESDISYNRRINKLKERILSGSKITKEEAFFIVNSHNLTLLDLFSASNSLRANYSAEFIELCAIINAKSGACSEDCSYCAQSSKNKAKVNIYPLMKRELIVEKALEAKEGGVSRFSIVTSGKKINRYELQEVAKAIKDIRILGLKPCASLGILSLDELIFLKESGLYRYHHNIETSEKFYPKICTTHTYAERVKTIEFAKSIGLSVCSGGIFGMGESWEDRIEMAFALKELNVDSVPINFLIPIEGTPLYGRELLHPFEALKVISLFRFILPDKSIRICGGRMQVLKEFHSLIFMAGADSVMTGNYLTTTGVSYEKDIALIRLHGFIPEGFK
ncbi:MAG: biotin synthase BioB [Thermodesulfovibrionales bacterium]|nr:biotin synthase BioB [Thermodesulfovibrionales bacterium]